MVSKIQQWDAGDWSDTVTGIGVGSRLYTVERDGTLYSTHAKSGDSKIIGEGFRTKLLVANGTDDGDLFAIEHNGNLYKVHRGTGEWEALDEDGNWGDTVAADANGNALYTVEKDGTLYVTDLETLESEELDTGYDTKGLWSWGDYVYVLEGDGSLYKVHGESGDWERFGEEHAYNDTVASTIHNGIFYAVENDGALGATSLEDGSYHEHDNKVFHGVRKLFSAAGNLYAIDKAGTLYLIDG